MIIGTANGDAVMMDSITGTLLGLLRDCNPSVNGTCGNDQMLLSAEADRSFLHTWSLHTDQPKYRCQAPERIRCLACTADGTHCAGGGVSGKNYLWEVASGRLLAGWDAHFKPCTVITFVGADSFIVSAGEDAMIFCGVWDCCYMPLPLACHLLRRCALGVTTCCLSTHCALHLVVSMICSAPPPRITVSACGMCLSAQVICSTALTSPQRSPSLLQTQLTVLCMQAEPMGTSLCRRLLCQQALLWATNR